MRWKEARGGSKELHEKGGGGGGSRELHEKKGKGEGGLHQSVVVERGEVNKVLGGKDGRLLVCAEPPHRRARNHADADAVAASTCAGLLLGVVVIVLFLLWLMRQHGAWGGGA